MLAIVPNRDKNAAKEVLIVAITIVVVVVIEVEAVDLASEVEEVSIKTQASVPQPKARMVPFP